jgi:hypothetical protein
MTCKRPRKLQAANQMAHAPYVLAIKDDFHGFSILIAIFFAFCGKAFCVKIKLA